VKYRFMEKHKGRHSIAKMAAVLGASRSGYYAWAGRKPSRHEEKDREMAALIERIFKEHHGRYGSPRVWMELKGMGVRAGRKRVERLMKGLALQGRRRRKRAKTTDSGHRLAVADNILNREFRAEKPGEKWVSDITYLRTKGGGCI
jgi:putative transposase